MRAFKCGALVFTAIAMAGPAAAQNPPPNSDLFKTVTGKWGWKDSDTSGCATGPHTIAFPSNKTAIFTHSKSFKSVTGEMTNTSTYDVLYAEANKITMYLQGELRRTEVGDRVLWVLILKDPNTYAWRRTDWPATSATKEIGRCP